MVLDAAGQPASGAYVLCEGTHHWHGLFIEELGSTELRIKRIKRTDASGRFRMASFLPDAEVTLSAWLPKQPTSDVLHSQVGTRTHPRDVTLHLPASIALSGRVVDAEGQPLADARLLLHQSESARSARSLRGGPLQTSSETDGQFRFPHWRPGPFTLRASLPGHRSVALEESDFTKPVLVRLLQTSTLSGRASGTDRPLNLEAPEHPDFVRITHVHNHPFTALFGSAASAALDEAPDPSRFLIQGLGSTAPQLQIGGEGWRKERINAEGLEPGERRDITVTLQPGRSLKGRALTAASGKQAPLEGVQISPSLSRTPFLVSDLQLPLEPTESSFTGEWELHGLPQAPLLLTARKFGYRPTRVRLPASQGEVTLSLEPHPSVIITTLDSNGAPLAGAVIRVAMVSPAGVRSPGGQDEWIHRSGPEGSIRILLPELGEYYAEFLPLAYTSDGTLGRIKYGNPFDSEESTLSSERISFTIARDSQRALTLQRRRSGRVEGQVLMGGRPLEGAYLRLQPADWPRSETRRVDFLQRGNPQASDAEGRFVFPRVAPGSYEFVAQAPNSPARHRQPLKVLPGRTHFLSADLPAGRVRGQLLLAQGAAESTLLKARSYKVADYLEHGVFGGYEEDFGYHTCRTVAEGAFELTGLPLGEEFLLRIIVSDSDIYWLGPFQASAEVPTELGTLSPQRQASLLIRREEFGGMGRRPVRLQLTKLSEAEGPPAPASKAMRNLHLTPALEHLALQKLLPGDYQLDWEFADVEPTGAKPQKHSDHLQLTAGQITVHALSVD